MARHPAGNIHPKPVRVGERDWDKDLEVAVSRGWIAERDGQYFATEAGQLIGKRTPAATGKPRKARIRLVKF